MALDNPERPQLLREARQPARLLALKEALGAGGPQGWRPNRLILINYWLFDYEIFHFVQGRLLLRGANGSGKTTVLVSAITLVLDAEKRRERLDPFGGQGRGLAYYLVGDPEAGPDSEFYFENRTGYVALEFEHARTGEYCTIGLGLRTSRSRVDQSVDLWGFVVTDGRRVGLDFDLVDPAGQPLAPRQLDELLGSGGRVVERASDYRELVNRYLFGFPRVEQYEFLLELLHQLRSPKLNRDIKPSVLCELLTDSLPALPGGLLDQVTRVIRDIDECMESLEETRRQLQAVEELNSRYGAYRNQVAQLAAVDYHTALGEYQAAATRFEAASAALTRAEEALAQHSARLEALQLEIGQLRSRKAALEQHEALKGLEALRWLEGQLDRAREAQRLAAQQAERSANELQTFVARLQAHEQEWRDHLNQLRGHTRQARHQAVEAAWAAAAQTLEGLLRAIDERQEVSPAGQRLAALPKVASVLSELGAARRQALEAALEALREVRRRQEQYREAKLIEDREREVLFERGREAQRCREALEAAKEEADRALGGWLEGADGVDVRTEEREAALEAIARYPADGPELSKLVAPLRPAFDRAAGRIAARLREAELGRERLAVRRDEVGCALQQWEGKEEAEPPRSQGQEQARRLLAEAGVPFLPLFAACELREGLGEQVAGRLEQALAEAGLLDALVVPREYADRVAGLLGESGLADRWLAPGTSSIVGAGDAPGNGGTSGDGKVLTLWDVLAPQPALRDDPQWEATVEEALRSVAWHPDTLPSVSRHFPGNTSDYPLVVGPAGFRAGPLWGSAEPRSAPAYLGRDNRRRTRQAEVERLRAELRQLEQDLWEAEAAVDRLRGELATLEGKWRQGETLPAWQALYEAVHRRDLAEEAVREQQARLDGATRRVREAFGALEAARAVLVEATGPLPEARGRDEDGVRLLIHQTDRTVQDALSLDRESAHEERLAAACRRAAADQNQAAVRLEGDRAALKAAREQVAELEGQVSARRDLLARLGVSVEALLEELKRLEAALALAEKEEKELLTRVGSLGTELTHCRTRLQEAQALRDRAAEVEAEARQKLHEKLRAHPSLRTALGLFDSGPDGPARAAEDLLKLRRSAEARLRESVEESQRQAFRELTVALQSARITLVELPPILEGDRLHFKRRGLVLEPNEVESELKDEKARDELILQQRETELYEQIILKDAGNEIRNRLEMAYRWRDAINAILREHRLVGGERLTLQWRPKPADRVTNEDPGRLVELLQRDPETLTDAEFGELVEQFRRRVNEVRRRFSDPNNQVVFAKGLADALDYRKWFQFQLMSAMPGESLRQLSDTRFAAGSGGQKSLRMFIPLVAAAYARYQGAAQDAPRLIGLDEAFAGVDEANTREMFGLLGRLGFSWMMTSEKLWGDFPSLPAGSVYELVKWGNVVTPVWFVWDGRQLLSGEVGAGDGATPEEGTTSPGSLSAMDGAHAADGVAAADGSALAGGTASGNGRRRPGGSLLGDGRDRDEQGR